MARELAGYGWNVTGVDPAPAMLAYARRQPDAHLVRWVDGDASKLGTPAADLAIMTGNVAQVFLEEADWHFTLHQIYDALRPGGYVAFESRNPEARGWERWNREATFERTLLPHGPMTCWVEVVSVEDGKVHFQGHNVFTETGEHLVADSTLRFRTHEEISSSLTQVGFKVNQVYGGWRREPFSRESQIMVFVAQRPESQP